MTVTVIREVQGDDFRKFFSFRYKKTAEAVVRQILKEEHCPYEAEADIRLVSDDEIRELNQKTRNIDRATDVLSFPMTQYPHPADFGFLNPKDPDAFDPESGELMLGDIVISVDRVREQALLYGHSVKREFAFLIAHSTLHLIGYDHIDQKDAEIMECKQEAALKILKITRDGGIL